MSNLKEKLKEIPFDLYTRHHVVSRVVNQAIRKGKSEKLSVLDLGGYAGMTTEFFPNDKVTILDIYACADKNYIKGDATNLEFEDNAYDIVTNFDVFEHIPREKRESFIKESFRVARRAVIMTMPIDNADTKETSEAELILDGFFKDIAGKHHPWLKEHIEYGIPSNVEVEVLFKKLKIKFIKFNSNDINTWKLMQTINFMGTIDSEALKVSKSMNRYYNENIENIEDYRQDGYRGIYILMKDEEIEKKILSTFYVSDTDFKSPNKAKTINKLVYNSVLRQLGNIIKQSTKQKIISVEKDEIISDLQRRIVDIENSTTWKITNPLRKLKSNVRGKL